MNNLLLVPVLLPLLCGALLMMVARQPSGLVRVFSTASVLLMLLCSVYLLLQADNGAIQVYALGNWAAPFGIVLVLDRLSALMLAVTAVLGVFVTLYAVRGDDQRGDRDDVGKLAEHCFVCFVIAWPRCGADSFSFALCDS